MSRQHSDGEERVHPADPVVPADGLVTCQVLVTAVSSDESLGRVVTALTRRQWSVVELHQRRTENHDRIEITATKRHGRPEALIAALQREVLVIRAAHIADQSGAGSAFTSL